MPLPRSRRSSSHGRSSWSLRDHLDGMGRALLEADRTPGAPVEVDAIARALAQLDDGVLRTSTEAAVALEAVPAREAPLGLEHRSRLGEAPHHLVETRHPARLLELALRPLRRLREEPDVELIEGGDGLFGRRHARRCAQVGIDATSH